MVKYLALELTLNGLFEKNFQQFNKFQNEPPPTKAVS